MKLIVYQPVTRFSRRIRFGWLTGLGFLMALCCLLPEAQAQIFVKQGQDGPSGFYRYDITTNQWATVAAIPFNHDNNGPIFTDGTYVYTNGVVEPKLGQTQLFRYDPVNFWLALPDKLTLVGTGPVFNVAEINFYYYVSVSCNPPDPLNTGCLQYNLYRRNLSNDSITQLLVGASTPSALVATGTALYSISGTSFKLWDENSQSFLPKANPLGTLKSVAVGDANFIYVLGAADQIYQYTIATNSWTSLPGASPVPSPFEIWSITTDGKKIYATGGGSSFYSYDLSAGSWATLSSPPDLLSVRSGANLIYVGCSYPSTACVPISMKRLR